MLKFCVSRHKKGPVRGLPVLALALVISAAALFHNYSADTFGAESDYDDEIESLEDELDEAADAADELEDEIEQAQSSADDLESEIDTLNSQLSGLSDDIEELNTLIAEKEEEIALLEEQIAAQEAEIAAAEAEIEENEEKAAAQYESLLAWIQVSYENNFDSLFLSVMTAESFSEVLSRAEYVQSLSEFGLNLIERYYETLSALETGKAELEEEESALKAQYESLNESLYTLDALENETSQKKAEVSLVISQSRDALSQLEDTIDSLEEQLAAQEAYEAELEEAKAKAEAAKAEEIAAQEAALAAAAAAAVVSTDASDIDLLAAIIYCEAGGESYEGQLAVGCVVINRVRSESFPDTISGVIYQSGQFTPVTSGRLATVLANGLTSDSCYEAAQYILEGNLPYPSYLYFCSASIDLGIETTVIGNHQFY